MCEIGPKVLRKVYVIFQDLSRRTHKGPYGPIRAHIWAHKGPYGPIYGPIRAHICVHKGPYGPIYGPIRAHMGPNPDRAPRMLAESLRLNQESL